MNKAVDYFADGGRRKDRWTTDFRPESERGKGAGPSETSQLSWGGAKNSEMYDQMAEDFERQMRTLSASRLEDQPLGSAASALVGESAKANPDLDSEVYDAARLAEVPVGDECKIDGPVELA